MLPALVLYGTVFRVLLALSSLLWLGSRWFFYSMTCCGREERKEKATFQGGNDLLHDQGAEFLAKHYLIASRRHMAKLGPHFAQMYVGAQISLDTDHDTALQCCLAGRYTGSRAGHTLCHKCAQMTL